MQQEMTREEIRAALTGPFGSVRTPFLEDGSIDYDGLRSVIDFNIEGGSKKLPPSSLEREEGGSFQLHQPHGTGGGNHELPTRRFGLDDRSNQRRFYFMYSGLILDALRYRVFQPERVEEKCDRSMGQTKLLPLDQ